MKDAIDIEAGKLAARLRKEAARIIGTNRASISVRDRFYEASDGLKTAVGLKRGGVKSRSARWRVKLVEMVEAAKIILGDDP